MEITLRQVFIFYMTYDILHLSQIKKKSSFLIYSKDTRGRRLYIATQGKLYIYLRLLIFIKFQNCVILWVFIGIFIIRPKAKNNCRFLDDDLARGGVQYRLSDKSYGRNKGFLSDNEYSIIFIINTVYYSINRFIEIKYYDG